MMDVQKKKYLKQNETKVYNCTFELQLFELRIFLKFPCKFFVEWKTSTGSKVTKTQRCVQCVNGKGIFDQKLLLQVEMLYDSQKKLWIKRDSTINVYLVTRSKPDVNQLAGRINIDLSVACQNNPYQQPLIQSLTHSSTSADLKFCLKMKYSLQSAKSVSELNLLDFSGRLHLLEQKSNLKTYKSLENQENMQKFVLPVYQVTQPCLELELEVDDAKPLRRSVRKLENLGHQVKGSLELQSNLTDLNNDDFGIRMTLGMDRKTMSRQDYEDMIQLQTKGMKKSNLMVIPDIKKSKVEDEDSQYNAQNEKRIQDDFPIAYQQHGENILMRKTVSQRKYEYSRHIALQSDVDVAVAVDIPDVLQIKEINQKNLPRQQQQMTSSMNSSNSFSISHFKTNFQGSGPQNLNISRSQKESFNSIEIQPKVVTNSNDQSNHWKKQYEAGRNRIKQLQNHLSELVLVLTDNKQKIQKLNEEKQGQYDTIKKFEEENEQLNFRMSQLQKRASQLKEKAEYELKIKSLDFEKLKRIITQLTSEITKIRSSQNQPLITEDKQLKAQIHSLGEKIKNLECQKESLNHKLLKRDQIQLQNQIKIQELQQELKNNKAQKDISNAKPNSSMLQIQLKNITNLTSGTSESQQKQQEYVDFLQEKIQSIEKQNIKLKNLSNQNQGKLQKLTEKDQRMRDNIVIIQKEFQLIARQLLEKQKLLEQKIEEVQTQKQKLHIAAYNTEARIHIKQKPLEEQLKKKSNLLEDYKIHIEILEDELQKVQKQNTQLTDTYNKLMRESFRFEGDLKVIKEKEEESFRESFGSSGEVFRQSFSHTLNTKQQSIVASYKDAVGSFYAKMSIKQDFEIEFGPEFLDLRRKVFIQLQRSTKIVHDLLSNIQSLQIELQETKKMKQKVEKTLQFKIRKMQTRDQLEEQEIISAGSLIIDPLAGSNNIELLYEERFDQFSEATKKKPGLNLYLQNRLNREVQKLKSIIYDKNKEISDLIASYEKLKIEKQTQSMLVKQKNIKINSKVENESDSELVHDILDLQIRLNKEKQKKNQVMEELELRKSLNRSQQVTQYVHHVDISTICKQIRAIIISRQDFIATEQTLNSLVTKINEMGNKPGKNDQNHKLIYLVEEISRKISKQLQVMKSTLLKMDFNQLQHIQCKSLFANMFKPPQQVINELLATVGEILNNYE